MKIVIIKRLELVAAIVLSGVVLFLLIVRTTHAGALWRDECDSVQLAQMPRVGDVFKNLQYTAFPILFPAIVRVYTSVFGATDVSVRCFGLAVGVAFLAAAWFHARTVQRGVPLLLLALIGLNTNFLTNIVSLRGYGLGSVLIVVAFALTARLLQQPTRRGLELVFLVYLISMQCLFFNGALVPAIVLASAVLCAIRRRFNWMLMLLGAAILCAISYVPYLTRLYFSVADWAVVLRVPIAPGFLRNQLIVACGFPLSIMPAIWSIILLGSVVGAVSRLGLTWRLKPEPEWDLLLFGLLTILASMLIYFAFLRVLHSTPYARYFVALFCLVAAAVDLIIANLCRFYWVRFTRLTLVLAATIALPFAAWPSIMARETNIDSVADTLQREAQPGDLIVVDPWTTAISFNRYYHGPTRWVSVPEMTEHLVHRYDLLKAKMTAPFPLESLEKEMSTTLRSGRRVWLVHRQRTRQDGIVPLSISPAPHPKFGWDLSKYQSMWSTQLQTFVRRHALHLQVVLRPTARMSNQEKLLLSTAQGWQD